MQRRLRIVMDHEHRIEPDGKTNWVASKTDYLTVEMAMRSKRDTLVIQP